MAKNIIGEMVRFHRKKSGLSQTSFAKLAGIGKTVVFDIENGKVTIRLETLMKVLHVLNIKIKFESPLMPLFEESQNEKS